MPLPVIVDDRIICANADRVFAEVRNFLSFLAMIDDLGVRVGLDGRVVQHKVGDVRPRAHRHAELEVNLLVRGTASYLLGDRRYALMPGTLTWLFPGDRTEVAPADVAQLAILTGAIEAVECGRGACSPARHEETISSRPTRRTETIALGQRAASSESSLTRGPCFGSLSRFWTKRTTNRTPLLRRVLAADGCGCRLPLSTRTGRAGAVGVRAGRRCDGARRNAVGDHRLIK